MGLAGLRIPHRPVEFRPQALVHLKIPGPRIPFPGIHPVPPGAPCDVPRQAHGFPLHDTPQGELLPLPPQAVPFQPVPQGRPPDRPLRQIRVVMLRDRRTEPLQAQQQPVLPGEGPAHGQGVGKFRAEAVHDVRLCYRDDFFQHMFQPPVIFFRVPHVLREAVIGKGGPLPGPAGFHVHRPGAEFLSRPDHMPGQRERHGQPDAALMAARQHSPGHPADPALLHGGLHPQLLRRRRQHHIT